MSKIGLTDYAALDATGWRKTSDGYLTATARVARTGIQEYLGVEVGRPDMKKVRVYRPPSEVFSDKAMHSFAHRPMTMDHPNEFVTSKNWRKYAIGQTGDEVVRDGQSVRVPLVLMDSDSIAAVESGERVELSMGYVTDLKWEDGETEDGEPYDAVQTSIRANHLALVKRARGGSALRIGDERDDDDDDTKRTEDGDDSMTTDARKASLTVDGITVDLEAKDAQIVQKHIGDLTKKVEAATAEVTTLTKKVTDAEAAAAKAMADHKAAVDAKDAEIATLKKQLEDAKVTPTKLDEMVKEREAVIATAKQFLGDKLVVDGKTVAEIRKQVVMDQLADSAKGWTDEQVEVSFNTLASAVKKAAGTGDAAIAAHLINGSKKDTRDEAIAERDAYLKDAWKGPQPN